MRPGTSILVVFGTLLGISAGLLAGLALAWEGIPRSAGADPASGAAARSEPALPQSLRIDGGHLVMVIATVPSTSSPTPSPTPAEAFSTPTARPLPSCETPTPGRLCEWPEPPESPTPLAPDCVTPVPGYRCVWPSPEPEARSIPSPPAG